ncbi:hypothetical protein Q0N71_23260 [Bacillus thuringiensis]|uniref:hypothetical protein n=1 Tax=Bacillus thuringiensis TaxID=1428 RepID=UPI003457F5AE
MKKKHIYSPANPACCTGEFNIIVDQGCEDFTNIGAAPIQIWGGIVDYVAFTFFVDDYNSRTIANFIVTSNGVAQPPIEVPSGQSATVVFQNVTSVTVQAFSGTIVSGELCYKIYKKQEITGDVCATNSICCQPANMVVDSFCNNIAPGFQNYQIIYNDFSPREALVTYTVDPPFIRPEAAASFLITLGDGATITHLVLKGQSLTEYYNNLLSIEVILNFPEVPVTGLVCTTIYRKFF